MAQIPTAPRLAAMMLEGERLGCGTDAALLAAVQHPVFTLEDVAEKIRMGQEDGTFCTSCDEADSAREAIFRDVLAIAAGQVRS